MAHHISTKELRRYYRTPATMDRIKGRYPLNKSQKRIIKRYERVAPGELAHIDITNVREDIRTVLKEKNLFVVTLEDDYTKLTYSEILKDKKATTLTLIFLRLCNSNQVLIN